MVGEPDGDFVGAGVGEDEGLPVGEELGDSVGDNVGEYVVSSHTVDWIPFSSIHWQAPSTKRSLSVNRVLHISKLFLFGRTKSKSASS